MKLALLLVCGLYVTPAMAQPGDPVVSAKRPVTEVSTPKALPRATWALGLATTWANRRDYGNVTRANFMPELTVQHYRPMTELVFLRPGLRMAYAGLAQAEMPKDLQVKERDLSLRAELAVLHDGPVVPMFSIGAGLIVRSVKLSSSGVVNTQSDPVSGVDVLPEFSVKTGLGIPFWRSALLLEPHLGMRLVLGDDREGFFYGVDLTYGWP